jgi:DNA polymerase-3 subunit delta'
MLFAMSATPLSDLIGQPDAVEFLRGIVSRGRFANAYLFHGPAGVGKGTAAIAFARALVCERSSPPPNAGQASLFGPGPAEAEPPAATPALAGDACGTCAACVKSRDLQHPDLRLLFPVSGEEKELDDTVAETLAAWREDPFFVFIYEKAASIRLSLTRELLRELAFHPYEAVRRVIVVRDADRMREDQYSAMLKSIEEPGLSTVWVLTTSRPSRLPATIRSRCQRVRFRPLPETAIGQFLRGRVGLDERTSRMLAALGSGSLGRALVLRDADPLAARNQALALLDTARRGDPAELWKSVQALGRFGRAGRETMRRVIEFQILWLRDLLRARYGAAREALVHRDREAEIRRLADTIDATEIRRRLMILEEALRSIEGNVSAEITLFSAMDRFADRTLSQPAWPRHPTARWEY